MGDGAPMFGDRLDKLISTMHPADRGPWTNEEVAEGIRSVGGPSLSVAYIQQLRRGRRDNPSFTLVVAMAKYFRVPVSYFSGEDSDEALTEEDVSLLNVVRSPDLKDLVLKLDALGPHTRQVIGRLVDDLIGLEPAPKK